MNPEMAYGEASVDIIICVHDALEDVKRCLESLTCYTDAQHRLIIVDDGSSQECWDYLAAFAQRQPQCTLIRNSRAKGYTKAANQGLCLSSAHFVVLLNSDTIVTSLWLERLLECANSDPRIGIVGPLSNAASWQSVPERFDERGDWAVNPLPSGWSPDEMAQLLASVSGRTFPKVPLLNGFCLGIKRTVLNSIGYLDEENFPDGYGEENDYCLRASAAGFQLAVADHTYIYHAKSRSYSHERRRALTASSHAKLQQKHGQPPVEEAIALLREEPTLAAIRRSIVRRLQQRHRPEAAETADRLSVLFLLPTEGGGGGAHSVVQEAQGMRQLGVHAQVAVGMPNREQFLKDYPAFSETETGQLFFFYETLEEVITYASHFDAVVATIFHSMPLAKLIVDAHPSVMPAYYVQDYEPWFFTTGSEYWQMATESYCMLPGTLLFAKTQWLCDKVRQEHGVEVHKVSPSLDHAVYFPSFAKRAGERPVRIAAMVRPSTPYRGAERTMRVLKRLKDEFTQGVEIHIFGCTNEDLNAHSLGTDFEFTNRGVLIREMVAQVLRESDMFLDFSDWQAFGRTGLEAMACGCAVVLPATGGVYEYALDRVNALIVDTDEEHACYLAARELVADGALRRALQRAALQKAGEYSIRRAVTSELTVLADALAAKDTLPTENESAAQDDSFGAVRRETQELVCRLAAELQGAVCDSQEQIRAAVREAQEQLQRRDTELQTAIDALRSTLQYQQLAQQVRDVVREVLPPSATVLVVSKGDQDLLNLDGRQGWHFPQAENGVYAGHYPADSAQAIAHLEALRAKGGGYLLIPSTAFWWLEHYADLRRHLDTHYRPIWSDSRCIIYALSGTAMANASARSPVQTWQRLSHFVSRHLRRGAESDMAWPGRQQRVAHGSTRRPDAMAMSNGPTGGSPGVSINYGQLVQQVRDVVREVLPPSATVLVVSKGDQDLLNLDGRQGWHFPQAENGVYAGHYPADSAQAIAHLEALRAKGGGYLLIPSTAFWWLEHYADLRRHLDTHYRPIWSDSRCIIYALVSHGWLSALKRRYLPLSPQRLLPSPALPAPSSSLTPSVSMTAAAHGGSVPALPPPPPPAVSIAGDARVSFAVTEAPPAPPLEPHRLAVEIIVCVHNALDDVTRCLDSVVRYTNPPYRIILVDDGSAVPTRDYVRRFAQAHDVLLLRNEQAKGYTFAANQGLRESSAAYALLLNSDTVVTPEWLDRMMSCAESEQRIGLVGPLSNAATWQSVPEITSRGSTGGDDWAENALPQDMTEADMASLVARYSGRVFPRIPFLNGFCLLIKRQVIQEIGHFDEATFGAGYGEENDYCLRARQAGWQLAVADDAYVYHRGSSSYSHERRRQLSRRADAALAEKYGRQVIEEGVRACRFERVLEGVRARCRVMLERQRLVEAGRRMWNGKRLLIVLPVARGGGGANIVLHEAQAMWHLGSAVTIVNLKRFREGFQRSYPDNKVPVVYVDTEQDIAPLLADYDGALATWCESVYWLDPLPASGRRLVRGYYIQDFEPFFFEPGTKGFKMAWNSYTRYPDLVRIAKTEWDRVTVLEHTGVESHVGGATIDIDMYRPRRRDTQWPKRPLRILAMIRPSTPRRAPKLTMEVLRDLKRRQGDTIEVVIFGCDSDDPQFLALPHDFEWQNAGILNRSQVAALMNDVDIFIDFSVFQAQGLTAMEAMACGVAVIVPQEGGATSFIKHEVNGLVVDTSSHDACLTALRRLTLEEPLRTRLQRQAVLDICNYYPEAGAFNTLKALFQDTNLVGESESGGATGLTISTALAGHASASLAGNGVAVGAQNGHAGILAVSRERDMGLFRPEVPTLLTGSSAAQVTALHGAPGARPPISDVPAVDRRQEDADAPGRPVLVARSGNGQANEMHAHEPRGVEPEHAFAPPSLAAVSGNSANAVVVNEHFQPKQGLELEPYLRDRDTTAVHHLIRYRWALACIEDMRGVDSVLDIACGSGYGTYAIARQFPHLRVVGADYDADAVALAKRSYSLPNLEYRLGDALRWDETIGPSIFGCIVSFDTVEHIQHRELFMENLVKHLHEDGHLLFSTPCGADTNNLTPQWIHHSIEYSAASLHDFLSRYFARICRPDDSSLPHLEVFSQLNGTGVGYLLKMNPLFCTGRIVLRNPYE